MEDNPKRQRDMARLLVGTLALIAKILEALPLRIGFPEIGPSLTATETMKRLERVRLDLIDSQPISNHAKELLKVMILEWYGLADICGQAVHAGASQRRLDTAEHQAELIGSASDHLAEELGFPPFLE
ncbi:hypothetical protein EDD29_0084 [Actinocorallia herbida]|uniref:Uncharacterized protein n=1 Tax=Actinocorallia herbida TaxID=58109 RepID=A0A3N1CMS9_9ACTN|nr:hypothetical protein [Actinocorallia herbida]ROO82603.1 hypothetical protein EDD29_0084 [Actinocorallia herbida]